MKHSNKISALVFTQNDASKFKAHLEQLHFVDDVVVIDVHGIEETASLASQNAKMRLYQCSSKDFSEQWNFASSKAKHNWLFLVDPNETYTSAIVEEISKLSLTSEKEAYSIKRQHYFMGIPIKYSGFQNDYKIKIFNKNQFTFNSGGPVAVNTSQKILKFTNDLPYNSYTTFDAFTSKLHQKSAEIAKERYGREEKSSVAQFLLKPFYRFWHQYLVRLGILDGKEGFILAYLSAFSEFKIHLHLWLLYRKIE